MNNHFQLNPTYVTLNTMEKFAGQLRWKVGLGTHPCVRTRVDKRCTFCGFKDLENPLPADEVNTVFQNLLKCTTIDSVNRLELYVSGSFLDDVEVSPKSRLAVLRAFSDTQIPEILIESRPEFIHQVNLNALTTVIEPSRVTIGIGVETMDDKARKPLLKGITTKKIIQSIQLIAKTGMNFQAYLLLKLPCVRSDREAVRHFMRDVQTLIDVTQDQACTLTIAVQPTFVARNTVTVPDFEHGKFRPVWLYTIALVLQKLWVLKAKNPQLRIILGNENDNVDVISLPSNYTHPTAYQPCSCSPKLRKLLQQVNESEQSLEIVIGQLLKNSCACQSLWQAEMEAV